MNQISELFIDVRGWTLKNIQHACNITNGFLDVERHYVVVGEVCK